MQLLRLIDLSMVYWLKTQFSGAGWTEPSITILDGYPEDRRSLVDSANYTNNKVQKLLPVVAVEVLSYEKEGLELGSRSVTGRYKIALDCFAATDGQRDDITYMCEKYTSGYIIPVYDYNIGFPPIVTNQSGVGHIEVSSVKMLNTSDKSASDLASRHSMRLILTCEGIEVYS